MNRKLTPRYYKNAQIVEKFQKLGKSELLECVDDIFLYMIKDNTKPISYYMAKSMGFEWDETNKMFYSIV